MQGVGDNGVQFAVPRTPDLREAFLAPSRWGPAELISIVIASTSAIQAFFPALRASLLVHAVVFLFWRTAYNFGLGVILHAQSEHRWLTSRVAAASPHARTILRWCSTAVLPKDARGWDVHPDLDAWLVFRALATVILVADGSTYLLFFAVCYSRNAAIMQSSIVFSALRYIIGVALVGLAVYVKNTAHHKLSGDYGWHWGDFFFLKADSSFVADGVFALFPHPMYTVGYAAYYGLALIARSHVLLSVSIIAQAGQMLFVYIVEDPHIQRTYSSPDERKASAASTEITPVKPPFNPFSAFVAILSSVYTVPVAIGASIIFVSYFGSVPHWLLLFVAAGWRVVHWSSMFIVSTQQESGATWSRTLARDDGVDERAAFQRWKAVFTTSYVVNHSLFLAAALCTPAAADASWAFLPEARAVSRIVVSLALTAISVFVAGGAHFTLGESAFCYSDLFIRPTKRVRYTDAYRILNHPAAVTEYFAYYAAALYRRSLPLLFFAVFAQLMHLIFVRYVEAPHMQRVYAVVREQSPIISLLGNFALDLSPSVRKILRRSHTYIASTETKAIQSVQETALDVCSRLTGKARETSDAATREAPAAVGGKLLSAMDALTSVDSEAILRTLHRLGVKINVDDSAKTEALATIGNRRPKSE